MTVKVGDKIAEITLKHMTADGPKNITTGELFDGKKVVVFGLPGAFTPTCSARHVPGFVDHFDAITAKGVDTIACVSVNDAFVMAAWGKAQNAEGKVLMLADGNADFAKALGLDADFSAFGMGLRSKRYSMLVENGVVTQLNIEEPGAFEVSNAETILGQL